MRRIGLAALAALATTAPAKADSGSATAYHRCDGSTTLQADGSRAHFGEVANNYLPLHTWIKMISPPTVHGRKFFRVDDRGGPGFALDFYAPSCSWMNWWGRRWVRFSVVPRSQIVRGIPAEALRASKAR